MRSRRSRPPSGKPGERSGQQGDLVREQEATGKKADARIFRPQSLACNYFAVGANTSFNRNVHSGTQLGGEYTPKPLRPIPRRAERAMRTQKAGGEVRRRRQRGARAQRSSCPRSAKVPQRPAAARIVGVAVAARRSLSWRSMVRSMRRRAGRRLVRRQRHAAGPRVGHAARAGKRAAGLVCSAPVPQTRRQRGGKLFHPGKSWDITRSSLPGPINASVNLLGCEPCGAQVLTVIAASRIPPWLPSGWGCRGRRLSTA